MYDMMQPLASRHRVALELRIVPRKPRPTREIKRVSKPIVQGLRERGRRDTPLKSGILSTSSESSSALVDAMTVKVGGESADRARGALSTDPFCEVVVVFQDEKLPERRLLVDWERWSKLVRLLSEVMEALWLWAGRGSVWAEVAWAVEVASGSRARELGESERLTETAPTGRGSLQSSPSSEPEDRLCIPRAVDGASAVSGRGECGDCGRERGVAGGGRWAVACVVMVGELGVRRG